MKTAARSRSSSLAIDFSRSIARSKSRSIVAFGDGKIQLSQIVERGHQDGRCRGAEGAARCAAQRLAKLLERQRVEHVALASPTPAARRARPSAVSASAPRECASLEITSCTPRSRASRALTSDRSRRSIWQLISSATPWRGGRLR